MGVVWASPSQQRRRSHPAVARLLHGLRRRAATGSTSLSLWGWRRGPELSEWRGALDALATLPPVAAGRVYSSQGARPVALTSEAVRVVADADCCHPDAGGLRAFTAQRRLR